MNEKIDDYYLDLLESVAKRFSKSGRKEFEKEEQRASIIKDALKKQKGFEWVKEELKENRLRALYTRNPQEFVLEYCLKINDNEKNTLKYDFDGYIALCNEIISELKKDGELSYNESFKGDSRITFGELKDYLEMNSEHKDLSNQSFVTENITKKIEKELDDLDYSSENIKEEFLRVFKNNKEYLVKYINSIRYYFSKYVYYAICVQIKELKEILLEYSNCTPYDVLKDVVTDYYVDDLNNQKSLKNFRNNNIGLIDLVEEYQKCNFDRKLMLLNYQEKTNNEKKIKEKKLFADICKRIIKATLKSFMLSGDVWSDKYKDSPLLLKKLQNSNGKIAHEGAIKFSKLEEKTYIFKSEGDFEGKKDSKLMHDITREDIESIQLSDFYGYRIDMKAVFDVLFDSFLANKVERKQIEKYINGILKGERDISRSILIWSLLNARLLLNNPDTFSDMDLHWKESDYLDVERVNKILDSAGFPMLGEPCFEEYETEYDRLYIELFDKEAIPFLREYKEYKDTLRTEDDIDYSAIPFEIIEKKVKDRQKLLLK